MWRVVPFDKRVHDRRGFDCGNTRLNDWLTTKVSQWVQRDLCRAYVVVDEAARVIGYYTLSSHHVEFEALGPSEAKRLPRIDVPVVLLGRLAVDRAVHGRGLGRFLLLNALSRVVHVADAVGIRAIEVEAVDESARAFDSRYGFVSLKDDPRHLFLSMAAVRALELPAH